ncbi:LuxR C-terminal-related transcriptional regulator [Solimonas terrae]|uniref:AAA family ATPase n=1 Tax=Solimonas terrae TaxID=1396819 RepID=A0A6M2BPU7_9GAMM|nr:LuxR C-terminal-related transcriptional regulator [Solimonas terrae]NGY04103.1 AAA family ATPase [Solimonas terrae]
MSTGDLPLIRTKLAPPRVGNAPVSRDAMLQRLDDGRSRRLVLVQGPAGCGKTMLLTQWRHRLLAQGAKVGWYNAGVDDNDTLAACYLVESLLQAGVTIDKEALHVYLRSGAKAWRPLIASLIDDVCSQDDEIYLVIDDLHHIASFGTLKLLDRWLAIAPGHFHLVLSSRTRPPLQTARLRAADEITELEFSELRFSRDETHRFLQGQGLQLGASQEQTLHDITDGWAAGLQLMAFTLRKEKDPEQFLAREGKQSLSRADALERYLETTVVEHLSDAELDFLVRVSACRRFNRELCELLTGDTRTAEHLARFENENLFLIAIDTGDAEPWYRFHRLFAEFLNRRLQRRDEQELRAIHHRASRWFAGQKLHVEAMRHATLANDVDFVVELIDRAARRMINGANFVELLKWCDAVPAESLQKRLNISLCLAWAQLACSRIEDFERNLAAIDANNESRAAEAATEVQLLRAFHLLRQDDTSACLAMLEPMLHGHPPVNTFNSFMLNQLASLSRVYTNDFERARELARQRHQIETRERPDYPRPMVDIVNGFSHLQQGNVQLATDSLSDYIEHALTRTSYGVDAAGGYAGYLLEALYQTGAIDQAQDFIDRYLELIEAVGFSDGVLFAYRVRARLQRLAGDARAARETLLHLEEIGYRKRLDRIVAWSLFEQLALAIGESQSAPVRDLLAQLDRLAARHGDAQNCAWSEIGLAALIAHAAVALAREDDVAVCLATIDAAREAATRNRRRLLSTQLGLMRAIVMLRSGKAAEAQRLARELLGVACETNMRRVLPDLGSAALPLIERLLKSEADGAARELLKSAADELRPSAPGTPAAKAESRPTTARAPGNPLSAREGEILALLGQGLSVKSIARDLNVSAGTVKWHVKNLYAKLNAYSKEDALARARKLRILA